MQTKISGVIIIGLCFGLLAAVQECGRQKKHAEMWKEEAGKVGGVKLVPASQNAVELLTEQVPKNKTALESAYEKHIPDTSDWPHPEWVIVAHFRAATNGDVRSYVIMENCVKNGRKEWIRATEEARKFWKWEGNEPVYVR